MRLNLGSGDTQKMKNLGYVNVDITKFDSVDVVHDIEKTLPFENDSVEEIYCSHALEHCIMSVVPKMLADWFRVSKKDGKIRIIVPEIEACMKKFLAAPETDPDKWGYMIEYVLGGQDNQEGQQLHKSAFTPTHLKNLVEAAGFVVDSLQIRYNGRNDCLYLDAHK